MDEIEPEMCNSDTLLDKNLHHRISLKSLPSLRTKDSLENIKIIKKLKQHSEYPKKNILYTFVKNTTFEKRSRHKLHQQKGSRDLAKKSNPELNVHKMKHKLTKEKGLMNFDVHKFGKKIINHFKKDFSEAGPSRMNFKTENLKRKTSNLRLKYDQNNIESETNMIQSFKKLSISESKPYNNQQTDFHSKSENLISENSSNLSNYESNSFNSEPVLKNINNIQNSGDVNNKTKFESDESILSKNFIEEQSEIVPFRKRSVQWNREVDVVYYAGDVDGGKIVGHEREPLREEADQQARHKKFDELIMRKNFLSVAKGANYRNSWLVALSK